MHFLHLNFLNVQGILAQNMYNVCVCVFRQFSNVKSGRRSQQPSVFSQLVTSEPQRTSISCANIVCIRISPAHSSLPSHLLISKLSKPLFLGNHPLTLYIGFLWPLLKVRFFSEPLKY